ncbi:heparinase II/III family protein [Chiayiivirga flava]|uniref:Heparin-sulfate lyase N-terminal domain-containing protein n=1 Tax=Chiayiivirga flava TaxID=659595 RepID=A0A7W8G195_9GAMM|nr:alginate lyase family protein [Chiayiivirga flava]MBB5209169.1 hypothetical protein [Chiayiivirga flava]
MRRVRTCLCALALLSPLANAALPTEPVTTFAAHIDLVRSRHPEVALERALAGQFQPREGVEPWPLTPPIDWNADPFADPNWRFQLHAWRMLDPLVLAYVHDADPMLLDRMLALARDWKRYHLDEGRRSEFGDYDMALGLRAQKLAWLHVALGAAGRESARDAVIGPLAQHARDTLLAQMPFSATNHGLFQVHGLLALCRAGATDCTRTEQPALAEFERLLDQQFLPDFGHAEHSPAYHFFALRTFRRMLASGWYAQATRAIAILDGAQAVSAWLSDPAGDLFAVGDSDSAPAPKRKPPQSDCALRIDDVCYMLKVLPSTGWAIARSAWNAPAQRGSALFFQAAHHSATHKHADDLSFVWFDRGRSVLIDPGRFGYVRDARRDYMASTRAHNAVQIDGRNQHTGGEAAYGSALLPSRIENGGIVLRASMQAIPRATRHTRTLVYRPQRMLLVLDALRSDDAHEYTHWFQFGSDVMLLPDTSSVMRTLRFDDGTTLHLVLSRDDCDVRAHRGETAPLQGWITSGYARAAPALSLAIRCHGTDSLLGTAFVWHTDDLEHVRAEMIDVLAHPRHADVGTPMTLQQESTR